MIEKILSAVAERYPLASKSVGEFSSFKAKGMRFTCSAYHAKGLGHLSIMQANGFFGLMKMDTLVICPEDKDLPLLSYDRIYAMGNDTLIMELYDTLLGDMDYSKIDEVISKYAYLPNRFQEGEEPSHWYDDIRLPQSIAKKGKKKHGFDEMVKAYVDGYLSMDGVVCPTQEKREKTSIYAEGLLKNGGPATDVLRKELGEEKTAKLLRSVLFGTQE